jgi:hypothetical protein
MVQQEPWTVTRSCDALTTQYDQALCVVVCRSTAVRDLSAVQLDQLALASQARNRCESITGVMVYDDKHFFQWLEGPVDSVDRVMESIKNDSRHVDIDILDRQTIDHRSFSGWSMKLATSGRDLSSWHSGIVAPPRDVVEGLRDHPGCAAKILLKMVPVSLDGAPAEDAMQQAVSQARLKQSTASLLKSVIISTVIPELVRQYAGRDATRLPPPLLAEAAELADLLIQPDQNAALELITQLRQAYGLVSPLYGSLFEPAARRLGDLWGEDICTEWDVTLGLSRLQTAVRLIAAKAEHLSPMGISQPMVLIVPEPGELHGIGAAMDTSVLSTAGWQPQSEFPADDHALEDLISAQWFDVLDLSLSSAFRREHWLPRINKTILGARRASLNPALIVLVGGRVFVEQKGALATAGADLASKTAFNVDHLILEKMQFMRGEGACTPGVEEGDEHRASGRKRFSRTSRKFQPSRPALTPDDSADLAFEFDRKSTGSITLSGE